jgi:hypothetical protein
MAQLSRQILSIFMLKSPFYPQKLALTSLTSCGCLFGVVRSRTARQPPQGSLCLKNLQHSVVSWSALFHFKAEKGTGIGMVWSELRIASSCVCVCVCVCVRVRSRRPWRSIGLWDVKDLTLSRQSAHRWWEGCQPYTHTPHFTPQKHYFYVSGTYFC